MAPPQPRKNNNTVLIVVLILVILVPCIGLLVVGAAGLWGFNSVKPMAQCMITFEAAHSAVLDYAKEKGQLPNAETWQTDVKSYYAKHVGSKNDKFGPFEPSSADGEWGCKNGDSSTGIAFNSDLSGKKIDEIKDRYATILLFEVEKAQMNARAKYAPRPDKGSPKIFGEERGWITVPVEGEVKMGKNGAKFKMD